MQLRRPIVGLVVVSAASANLGPNGSLEPEYRTPPSAAVGALLTASSTAMTSVSPVISFVNATTGVTVQVPEVMSRSTRNERLFCSIS
jgi:hypothetical protein